MKLTIYRIVLIVFAVFSLCFITYNSAQTAEESTKLSNGVSEKVAEVVVPDFNEMDKEQKKEVVAKISIPVREIAHALEFASLAFFLALLTFTFPFSYGRYPVAVTVTLLFGFAFALFDEWLQTFSMGRGTQWLDVWIDSLGTVCGIILAVIVDIIGVSVITRRKRKIGR